MGQITKQHDFATGTVANPSEVNQNYDDIISFLNNDVVHRDGSKEFSGIPTLPGVDPSSDNHATRKSYVDRLLNLAAKVLGRSGSYGGGYGPSATTQLQVGTVIANTDGAGNHRVNYQFPFPSGTICVLLGNGDGNINGTVGRSWPMVQFPDNAGFTAHWVQTQVTPSTSLANQTVRLNYVAFGW